MIVVAYFADKQFLRQVVGQQVLGGSVGVCRAVLHLSRWKINPFFILECAVCLA